MAVSCCLGSSNIALSSIFDFLFGRGETLPETTVTIITKLRIPRVLTAALIGGALASIGAVMQGIFKNPMADPSVLGISSGAALGAAIAIVVGLNGVIIGAFTGAYIGAVIGAVLTWFIIITIAKSSGEYDTSSTLLAGIATSSLMSALITVIMTLNLQKMERIYMWMLGTFSASTVSKTIILAIVVMLGLIALIIFAPMIDVLKLGKETAETLGVKQGRTLAILMTISSIILAFCVANAGVIGFVGLIIPHIVSFFKVYKMRSKIIMCFLVGAIFTVICDTICKIVIAPGELPIGAVTSLIGAPYFLFLLLKARRQNGGAL
ncbi:MAG: iron ABC transporter permease [Saccharofermentans sp.]|nr:iron ABC transporter permease [Saccharofermentans sp.]